MVIHLYSPDDTRDQLYISNYATLHVKDVLSRIDGVGNVTIFGARDYSMRIWLDPEKLAIRNLTAGDVVAALRGQNVQVAAGVINQPPVPSPRRLPAQRRDARTPHRHRGLRQHHRQIRHRRPRGARSATSAASSSAPRTTAATAISTSRSPCRSASSSARARTRSPPPRKFKTAMEDAVEVVPRRAQIRHRLQPDRVHLAIRARP